jgi:hypothetical protein
MDDTPTRQVVAAEVLGTFVLVLFGCGSLVFWGDRVGLARRRRRTPRSARPAEVTPR